MATQFSNKGKGELYLRYLKAFSAVRSGAPYVLNVVDPVTMIVVAHAVEDANVLKGGGDLTPGAPYPHDFDVFRTRMEAWYVGLESSLTDEDIK